MFNCGTLTIFAATTGELSIIVDEEGEDELDYDAICDQWVQQESEHVAEYNFYLNRMPLCPCWAGFLFIDPNFYLYPWWRDNAPTFSTSVMPSPFYDGHGKVKILFAKSVNQI